MADHVSAPNLPTVARPDIAGVLQTFPVLSRQINEAFRTYARVLNDMADIVQYIKVGSGSPAGNVAAPVGTLYLRTNGVANLTLFVKESGTGTSGWAAK